MTTTKERTTLLHMLGLTDQKIEETSKNEALTNLLVDIINHVRIKINLLFNSI
jgi:hypothetical protein